MKLYFGNMVTTVTTIMVIALVGFIGYSVWNRNTISYWGRRNLFLLTYGLVICCFAAARDGLDKTIQAAVDGSCTPAICGYLDLLEQEEVVDNVAKYLNVIRERTNVMRSLTEELFRYSLMALQEEELHIEQVCINDILEQSLVGFYGVFTKKDIIPDIQMPEIK